MPEQLGADGMHVNGALTIGENIGDLGGLSIAVKAYLATRSEEPDGLAFDFLVDPAEAFLAAHPGWSAETLTLPFGRTHGAGVRLTPAHDGTDGFFVARLVRA